MRKLRTAMLLLGCAAVWASSGCEGGGDDAAPDANSGGSASGGEAGSNGDAGAGADTGGSESGGSAGSETGGSSAAGGSGGTSSTDGASTGGASTGGASTGGSGGGAAGDCGWTYMVGGTLEDRATDVIALDDGSVVVVGTTASTNSALGTGKGAFALRLSQEGALLWSRVYPGAGSPHVAPGHNGRLVLVGTATAATACEEHHGLKDAWIAEISKDDGELLAQKCIGGDDDDTGVAVVARGSGGSAHYVITGEVDSHDNGNVGPNYNEGFLELTDALLGYWDLSTDTAWGHCFGSNSIDRGAAVLGDDVVFVNANASDPGDYGSEAPASIDVMALTLSSNGTCASKPCGTVTRHGGPGADTVDAATGTTLVGRTSSTSGEIGCPGATNTAHSVWLASYENGAVSGLGCLSNGGNLGLADVAQSSSRVAITGLLVPANGGDFASATLVGTLTGPGSAGYVALYDGSFAAPKELVVVGNQTHFYGVTFRPDSCVVAVGTRVRTSGAGSGFGDVFVYTRPVE